MSDLTIRVVINAVTDGLRAGVNQARADLNSLSTSVQSGVASAISTSTAAAQSAATAASSALTATTGTLTSITRSASTTVSSALTTVSSGISALSSTTSSAVNSALSTVSGSFNNLRSSANTAFSSMKGIFATLGVMALAKDILDTNREMESLRTQLESVTGSAEKGAQVFDRMLQLATDTPFEIKGLTKSYVMLKNFGLEPTAAVMDALTNQVSKLGGSADTLAGVTLALGQAWGKGKLQAQDINQMVERGVPVYDLLTKVTGKQSAELLKMSEAGEITRDIMEKLIAKMGEMAEGSNTRAMETLNGKISVLADSWHKFEDALLQDKSEGFIKKIVSNWSGWLDVLSDKLNDTNGNFEKLEKINERIASRKSVIRFFETDPVKATALAVATGTYKGEEENALKADLLERQKIIEAIKAERDAKRQATDADAKALADSKALVKQQMDMADHAKKVADWSEKYADNAQKMAAELAKAKAELGKDFTPAIEKAITDKFSLKHTAQDFGNHLDEALAKASKKFGFDLDKVQAKFAEAAKKYGIDENLLKAQAKQESGFNPKVESSVGAVGFSQFMPDTAKRFGLTNSKDPIASIEAQAKYMALLLEKFNGRLDLALAGYNAGENRDSLKKGFIPHFPETQAYVKTILSSYDKAKQENGGSGRDTGLLAELESKTALLENQFKATVTTAESDIKLNVANAEHESKTAIDALKRLKDSGAIGVNDYYAELTDQQEKAIKANLAAISQKLALAAKQFEQDKNTVTPEQLPTIEANYSANHAELLQQQKQFNDAILALYVENNAARLKENNAAAFEDINRFEEHALERLALAKEDAQQQLALGEITQAEFLAKQQGFENRRYQIAKNAIALRRALISPENQPENTALNQQNNAEDRKHAANTKGNDDKVDLEKKQRFDNTFAPLKNALDQSINGILTGQQTIANAARHAAQSIALSYAQAFIKTKLMAAAQWAWEVAGFAGKEAKKKALLNASTVWETVQLVGKKAVLGAHWLWETFGFGTKEAVKVGTTVASEATQTAAVATGTVARTAIERTANAASSVMNATRAAQGAFAWVMAEIPWPFSVVLAPVAAAAAFAGTLAVGSAKGGEWQVDKNGAPYVLHENESVLPAGVAENFRNITQFVKNRVLHDEQATGLPDMTQHIQTAIKTGTLTGGWSVPQSLLTISQDAGQTAEHLAGKSRAVSVEQLNQLAGSVQKAQHSAPNKPVINKTENILHFNGVLSAEAFIKQNSSHIVKAANSEARKFNTGKR